MRPKRIALRTKDLSEAVRLVTALRVEEGQRHPERLDACAARYVRTQRELKNHSRVTSRSTRDVLLRLTQRMNNRMIGNVTTEDLVAWQRELLQERQEITVTSLMIRVRGFFTWAVEEGLIVVSPMKGVKQRTVYKTSPVVFMTREQRDRLVEVAKLS